MATGHSISVITNSCIKPPVNPDTGLSATLNERTQLSQSFTSKDFIDYDEEDDEKELRRSRLSRPRSRTGTGKHSRNNSLGNMDMNRTDEMIEQLTSNVDNLTDAEFYERLIDLKNEHKKTLSMCEQLYNEKVAVQNEGSSMYYSKSQRNGYDQVRDMSGKPPMARPLSANKAEPRRSKSSIRAPYSVTTNAWQLHSDEESDGENHRSLLGSNESLNELNESFNGYQMDRAPKSRQRDYSPMGRIDDMWDNFSVEDYAPNRTRSETTMESQNAEQVKEWRHRITIPKPFKMSLREAHKPKKNTSNEEYLMERAEKEKMEEMECQKKFKATPAPAHVYLPLYDEIMEVQETKRRVNHELRGDMLRSTEKPFKFMQREDEKKRHAYTKAVTEQVQNKPKVKRSFKARPVSEKVVDDSVAERIREEEEYRKIRMKMRSVDMLRESKLPPSMALREQQKRMGVSKSTKKKMAQTAKSLGISSEPSYRPKINETVPNFEEKHRKLMREMSNKKYEKEATVMKPFNLRTARIPSRKHEVYEDMERDEETLKETRWPYTNPRAKPSPAHSSMSASLRSSPFSSSAENIPARMTASQELRTSVTKQKLERMSEQEMEELRKEKARKLREKKLQKFVAEKAAANELSLTRNQEKEKLRKIKEQDRARMVEYRNELQQMKSRVESRPLLFEQTSQVNARQAAERKYQETLKSAGIDEEFVQRKGQRYRPEDRISDADSGDESYSPVPVDNGLSDGDMSEVSDDEKLELA